MPSAQNDVILGSMGGFSVPPLGEVGWGPLLHTPQMGDGAPGKDGIWTQSHRAQPHQSFPPAKHPCMDPEMHFLPNKIKFKQKPSSPAAALSLQEFSLKNPSILTVFGRKNPFPSNLWQDFCRIWWSFSL